MERVDALVLGQVGVGQGEHRPLAVGRDFGRAEAMHRCACRSRSSAGRRAGRRRARRPRRRGAVLLVMARGVAKASGAAAVARTLERPPGNAGDFALHMLVDHLRQMLVEPLLEDRPEHLAHHVLERVDRAAAAGTWRRPSAVARAPGGCARRLPRRAAAGRGRPAARAARRARARPRRRFDRVSSGSGSSGDLRDGDGAAAQLLLLGDHFLDRREDVFHRGFAGRGMAWSRYRLLRRRSHAREVTAGSVSTGRGPSAA